MDFDKETMRSLMIDHIDGKITGELAKYVELHIEKNEGARKEYNELEEVMSLMSAQSQTDVPPELKASFVEQASDEMKRKPKGKVIRLDLNTTMKVAAAVAFVVFGYFAGTWINNLADQDITHLENELKKTKELVLMSMMKQGSASERLKGILASSEIIDADEDIIDALITAMNNDDNINVRIAAAEALQKFQNNEKARLALIASLNNQEYPAVQMKLIDILVVMGDKDALEPMQNFADKESILKSVKDEAYMGIFKLM